MDYTRILVAIDFSEASQQVIQKAVAIAQRNNAQLTALHVVEYLPPIDIAYEPVIASGWDIDEEMLQDQAQATLQKLCDETGMNTIEQNVIIGMPRVEICRYAREKSCDLVIIGSHGRHGIRLLLGSTANGILHDMPCDVLAVKVGE